MTERYRWAEHFYQAQYAKFMTDIIKIMYDRGLTIGEIGKITGATQSTVKQFMKLIK